jgi:hypothetical protein
VGALTALLAWQAWTSPAQALQDREFATSRAVGGGTTGEVVVKDDVALRIRYGAGVYTATERADKVAGRLNELHRAGRLKADELKTGTVSGMPAVLAGDELIITADSAHARANGTTPHRLAHQWRNNLAVAMGGKAVAYMPPGAKPVAAVGQDRVAGVQAVEEETRTKIVPILSVGSGGSIGIAQVSGTASRVSTVKAVAQIATDYKDAARIRIMVPISTEKIISNIERVPQVSVTGVGALRL